MFRFLKQFFFSAERVKSKEVRELTHQVFLHQWKEAGCPQADGRSSLGWMDAVYYRLSFDHEGCTYETLLATIAGATPDAEPELLELWNKAFTYDR